MTLFSGQKLVKNESHFYVFLKLVAKIIGLISSTWDHRDSLLNLL